ncbi:unnamed protein product, partial [marine sediment metagenome]
MWSPIFTFHVVSNLPPIVNAGDDVDTWLLPPDAERVVQLNGIVTDDGFVEPYTVVWTVVSEPNSVTHPAVISEPYIVNPTITMTLPGLYELELEADDGELTSSDTIDILLYDDDGAVWAICLVGDLNNDCKVNMEDLKLFAEQWLDPPGGSADLVGNDGVNLGDFALLAANWNQTGTPPVIINEIHYDPDVKVELVEFVELYNAGSNTIDLSGWYFSKGIDYTFPPGTNLPPFGYVVVTEDPSLAVSPVTVCDKYGTDSSIIYG